MVPGAAGGIDSSSSESEFKASDLGKRAGSGLECRRRTRYRPAGLLPGLCRRCDARPRWVERVERPVQQREAQTGDDTTAQPRRAGSEPQAQPNAQVTAVENPRVRRLALQLALLLAFQLALQLALLLAFQLALQLAPPDRAERVKSQVRPGGQGVPGVPTTSLGDPWGRPGSAGSHSANAAPNPPTARITSSCCPGAARRGTPARRPGRRAEAAPRAPNARGRPRHRTYA